MTLLYDENLPRRFVNSLADLFPESRHVSQVMLDISDDRDVWTHARQNGLAIVSKDSDFRQMSFLYGPPPKVIWLRCGNCSTSELEQNIRHQFGDISSFLNDESGALLVLGTVLRTSPS